VSSTLRKQVQPKHGKEIKNPHLAGNWSFDGKKGHEDKKGFDGPFGKHNRTLLGAARRLLLWL
jgi:hypothetical protein